MHERKPKKKDKVRFELTRKEKKREGDKKKKMHSRYNSVLKFPKEEEQEVPDDGSVTHELSNVVVSGGSRDEFAHVDGTDFADELEGILGIPDDDGDDEALSKDKYCSGAQLMSWELDFMDWDQEFSPEEFKNINLENRSVVKRESSCCTTVGFWDEYVDDEQKVCLNLNLNYQQVLDAWSDRGPLLANHSLSTPTNGCYMGEVPVMEEEKNTRREASVLRYKEKRQTRLFSKKIRYQVRKLNADNRPRQKGRFVKRVSS